jgi:hypothetical protein
MKKALLILLALLVIASAAFGVRWWQRNAGFTPWMSRPELDHFLSQYDTVPPGGHPNYWDKGHWINAVEGRWHGGVAQYRIRYGPVPRPNKGIWWYWYINQPQETFTEHVNELGDDGFVLLDPNSCVWPDGTRRFQGVWHKVIPANTGTAAGTSVTSR